MSGLPIYKVWLGMQQRCTNPSDSSYRHYGARGITVCERWNSIHAFLVDMGHPPAGHSIGRIDNDGNYEPSNCRWETQEQQNENTRRNRYITWQGRTQTIKAWAKELDMEPRRISERLARGWTLDRTLTTPTPLNYTEGRNLQVQRAREDWAANGKRYRSNDASPRNPVKTINRPSATHRLSISPRNNYKPRTYRVTTPDERLALTLQAQELHQQGYSCRQIAHQLGISKSSVSNYLNTPNSSAA